MKRLFFVALLLLGLPISAFATAAGSCVFSSDTAQDPFSKVVVPGVELEWVCTANSSGAITTPVITDASGAAYSVPAVSGRIARVQLISGTGLSAGNVLLYSGTDTTDDLIGGIGSTISTSSGNVKTEVPVTTTNKMPRELRRDVPVLSGTGLGNGGHFTLKVLLRW